MTNNFEITGHIFLFKFQRKSKTKNMKAFFFSSCIYVNYISSYIFLMNHSHNNISIVDENK